jgi:translation initiation factor 1
VPFRPAAHTLDCQESGFVFRGPVRKEYPAVSSKKRIPIDGGQSFGQNPFAGLSSVGLPPASEERVAEAPNEAAASEAPRKNRGRVDILRQTAHRGGKTVTVVTGFVGIGLPEKEKLAKTIQRACGTGGTVKEGRIEIQGDKRTDVARILSEAGFRVVFAGG